MVREAVSRLHRRTLLGAALAAPAVGRSGRAQGTARIAVVGGGWGGATIARRLARAGHGVTLIEQDRSYVSAPCSNQVVAGLMEMERLSFTWDRLAADGVTLVTARATGVDTATRRVLLDGATIPYDCLVLSPGVHLLMAGEEGGMPGYDPLAAVRMPHAWKPGLQTVLLREQLRAMPDGGTVILSVPRGPCSGPTYPYERASLIAHRLKTTKPRSKLLLLDANDSFNLQKLFQQAWAALYPGLLERVAGSDGGIVTGVDAEAMTVSTASTTHKADVACIIPAQRAGTIALAAGLGDKTGWCPVDPLTYESARISGIYVIGDAAALPASAPPPLAKTAFAANLQAKLCADSLLTSLAGQRPALLPDKLVDATYSLAAPGYGFSVVAVYQPNRGLLTPVDGAGGPSALDAPPAVRAQEAADAETWYATLTRSVFG